ncbi:hypothetical protein PCASD_06082 [Puccinia coronata f. sp. avenae]|uniref:Uncharacterized protein n=1 Tax=Puccinia coronata f. sp. avenae TaxID=200324 RepID=A0A2N5UZD6_9BASI|nr:hypothetical protein PCASD_18235 [Puccinia coronata f. sp. avenae]PLW43067.1 hypothetical protein PCASD_06082 [Puccinia coronata f. sp. avenae]
MSLVYGTTYYYRVATAPDEKQNLRSTRALNMRCHWPASDKLSLAERYTLRRPAEYHSSTADRCTLFHPGKRSSPRPAGAVIRRVKEKMTSASRYSLQSVPASNPSRPVGKRLCQPAGGILPDTKLYQPANTSLSASRREVPSRGYVSRSTKESVRDLPWSAHIFWGGVWWAGRLCSKERINSTKSHAEPLPIQDQTCEADV